MKNITIIIPTRNRLEYLKKTLKSIPKEGHISVVVICDGDLDTYCYLQKTLEENVSSMITPENKGTVYCRNLCTPDVEDGILCAMDSVIFNSNAFGRALAVFNENFPDDDGVLGFGYEGRGSCTSLPLVGQRFLHRYPGKQLYCPKYFHFACQEISSLCFLLEEKHKKRFIINNGEYLATKQIIRDKTYKDARRFKYEDLQLKEKRERESIIWGM